MTVPATEHDRAVGFYSRLIALYPKGHRDAFGPHMVRTFDDSYKHATAGERRAGTEFWLAVLWDEACSIVREHAAEPHGDILFGSLIAIWAFAVLIVSVIPGVGDWHQLVVPAGILGVLFLIIPGASGIARRFATVVVVVATCELMGAAGQSMKDPNDLLAPTLLLACMTFSIKTLSGLNARIVGSKDRVWAREELAYGALVGLVGMLGLTLGTMDPNDSNPAVPLFFVLAVPFVCGVAGFRSSRQHQSVRSGIYAALGAMLIGATIWFLAEPLVIKGVLLTVLRDHPVPPATLLPYWRGPLSNFLFWAAVIGIVGAIVGQITRETTTASHSQSQPSE